MPFIDQPIAFSICRTKQQIRIPSTTLLCVVLSARFTYKSRIMLADYQRSKPYNEVVSELIGFVRCCQQQSKSDERPVCKHYLMVVAVLFFSGAWRVQFLVKIWTRLCVCMCCLRQFIYCCVLLSFAVHILRLASLTLSFILHSQRTAFLLCYQFFLESCLFDD